MDQIIYLDRKDNVATALADFAPGETIDVAGHTIRLLERIPFGHKVSVCDIQKEGLIYKYGAVIGKATQDIPAGSVVHIHNITSLRGLGK